MKVHELIREYRIKSGLTQQEMAKNMKMERQTYARMEKGETAMTDNKVELFAKLVGKTPNEIRKIAEHGNLINLLTTDNAINESRDISNLIVNNHYYGENELIAKINQLEAIILEKDKQIELFASLLRDLKNK